MLFGAQTSQHSEVEMHSYTTVIYHGYLITAKLKWGTKWGGDNESKTRWAESRNPPNQKSQDGSFVNEFRIRYFKCVFQLNNLGQVTGFSWVSKFVSVKWG